MNVCGTEDDIEGDVYENEYGQASGRNVSNTVGHCLEMAFPEERWNQYVLSHPVGQ